MSYEQENEGLGAVGELLGAITQNPKMLQGIVGLLGNLGEKEALSAPEPPTQQGQQADRKSLLLALKPFLHKEHAKTLELVIKLLEVIQLLEKNPSMTQLLPRRPVEPPHQKGGTQQ